MTDEQARALGERWIKAGGGWYAGMTDAQTSTVRYPIHYYDSAIPDLRDPATRGAALQVVRERWREPSYSLTAVDESCYPIRWEWIDGGLAAPMLGHPIAYQQFDSEAEALVAALEALPLPLP